MKAFGQKWERRIQSRFCPNHVPSEYERARAGCDMDIEHPYEYRFPLPIARISGLSPDSAVDQQLAQQLRTIIATIIMKLSSVAVLFGAAVAAFFPGASADSVLCPMPICSLVLACPTCS
eukprot:scaffold4912_cov74-Skeletonema_dohrnii-CCMP3373.AAC.5